MTVGIAIVVGFVLVAMAAAIPATVWIVSTSMRESHKELIGYLERTREVGGQPLLMRERELDIEEKRAKLESDLKTREFELKKHMNEKNLELQMARYKAHADSGFVSAEG